MKLYKKTAAELSVMLQKKECSAAELLADVQERITETENTIGAYITISQESMQQAHAVDAARARGEVLHPLAGIPIAVKDNISTKGLRTTCASRMLEHYIPPYDATVVQKLKYAGMVIIGKTNMDEFAMGSSTETSYMHLTRNPRHTDHVPGGSSGGSAAAVACGETILALGSDTGGSIRQPAAFCGVVGIKPTYGSVSRYGLVAYASSFDQIGTFGKSVMDSAMLLQLISGYDPMDATCFNHSRPDAGVILNGNIKGLRIGIPKEYFGDEVHPEVHDSVMHAVRQLESLGAVCREISLPNTVHALRTYYILASAEASSNLARYDGVKYGYRAEGCADLKEMYERTRSEGFGREVKRRIMLGTFVLSAGYYESYYQKAKLMQRRITQEISDVFQDCNMIAAPAAPTPAFRIGEKISSPLQMYNGDFCTVTANLAGLPAISIPCGSSANGLPIGLQLMGNRFSEPQLLNAAYAYEQHGSDFTADTEIWQGGDI